MTNYLKKTTDLQQQQQQQQQQQEENDEAVRLLETRLEKMTKEKNRWESSTRLLEEEQEDGNDDSDSKRKVLYGLMIALEEEEDDDDANNNNNNNNSSTTTTRTTCRMKFVPDANYSEVHPNIYAPQALTGVTKLGGGGSGVTVFSGTLPNDQGDVIMKHGGYKDTREVFALATIAHELELRFNENDQKKNEMKRRLPKFQFLYISPKHLRSTSTELWKKLRKVIFEQHQISSLSSSASSISDTDDTTDGTNNNNDKILHREGDLRRSIQLSAVMGDDDSSTKQQQQVSLIEVRQDVMTFLLKNELVVSKDGKTVQYGLPGNGFEHLKSLVDKLVPLQKHYMWKFTQAQKAIGGPNAVTGSSWLLQGKLTGTLLQNLIAQMIQVVRDLQSLTRPEEYDILDKVQEEVQDMIRTDEVIRISDDTDDFFGNAILKNFHPKKGRFPRIRAFGKQFRSKGQDLVITPEEEIPAYHLGQILDFGSKMGVTYQDAPMEAPYSTLFDSRDEVLQKLGRAVNINTTSGMMKSPAAHRRIWTCGLADAGIHNLFLSETDLWLFDLGQPHLESTPGFLTKFLFSFFHTLGMEETTSEDGEDITWVKRFISNGKTQKLELTPETKDLLSKSYTAFETVLDSLVAELFDQDDTVRETLVLYVTLQLLSDASFCLERWSIKGGGRSRNTNHQKGIEKWLWRALWDIYVAFDLNTEPNLQRLKCCC